MEVWEVWAVGGTGWRGVRRRPLATQLGTIARQDAAEFRPLGPEIALGGGIHTVDGSTSSWTLGATKGPGACTVGKLGLELPDPDLPNR